MKKKIAAGIVSVVLAISLTACGSAGRMSEKNTEISKELEYDHSMELEYAEEFSVDYYQDGYALVTIADDGQYLVVPEGKGGRAGAHAEGRSPALQPFREGLTGAGEFRYHLRMRTIII